jgi:hypothetical protein
MHDDWLLARMAPSKKLNPPREIRPAPMRGERLQADPRWVTPTSTKRPSARWIPREVSSSARPSAEGAARSSNAEVSRRRARGRHERGNRALVRVQRRARTCRSSIEVAASVPAVRHARIQEVATEEIRRLGMCAR